MAGKERLFLDTGASRELNLRWFHEQLGGSPIATTPTVNWACLGIRTRLPVGSMPNPGHRAGRVSSRFQRKLSIPKFPMNGSLLLA